MYLPKISITALLALLTYTSTPVAVTLPALLVAPQALAQTPADRKTEADRLFQQGIVQFETSQFEAALQSWQQALVIYQEIKDRRGEAKALGNLGVAYNALGYFPRAIESLQQQLTIAREIKDRQTEAKALGELGVSYGSLGDYSKAIDYFEQTLAIAKAIKDRQSEGASLGNLAATYLYLGEYAKAIDYHQQQLAIAREIKDRISEANALSNLGKAYRSLGDLPRAIEYEQQSLALARQIQDRAGESASLGNLGSAYHTLGDYGKALDYYQQALAIAQEIKDRRGVGQALGGLGLVYNSLGDYAKAIDYQQQWLDIARQIQDRRGEGSALGNMGMSYYYLGDYAKAIDYQRQSLAIAKQIQYPHGEGSALGNLGLIYYDLGNYAKAIDYHEQHLAIAKAIKDRQGEGYALGNIGNAYLALGKFPQAIEYQQQWLAIAREIKDRNSEAKALGNLGSVYFSQGDFAKVIEYQQQTLAITREIKDRNSEAKALGNLGSAYVYLGDLPRAIDYQQQRLAIARQIKDRHGEGAALNNLGVAFYDSGNLVAAENILMQAIEVWESQRARLGGNDENQISIFEQQARSYRLLQKVLIAQNKTDVALEIAERGRARAFVQLLNSRLLPTTKSVVTAPEKPTVNQIKQIAQAEGATLVQYSIVEDEFKVEGKQQAKESELYIWVIKPTGEVTFRKADLKPLWQKENTSLADLVTSSRESIGVRGRGIEVVYRSGGRKGGNRLQRLHELLIKPIADLLPTKQSDRIVFIPQSSLFLAPFPALQDEKSKYLIEKHTILTSPSIQVLALTNLQKQNLLRTQNSELSTALVVGNPTMPKVAPAIGETPEELPPLPGAENEAKAIAPLLKTQALTGNQATKTTILPLLPKARIIHLATHGLLDDIQGLDSAIALAPSREDNGLLTAEDILNNLKLNAELVVLSACDTGRGRITGDGVIGLSRSWISAGTPSIIVSLWSVPDAPTASLMTQFYQNLQKNPDKAQALRQAMLTTMKQHPNPRDWAAFTLIGEAE